jgi:trehalose-phosphatase
MMIPAEKVLDRLADAPRLWLLLDYDGTLAEFAPTPDHVLPDSELIALIRDCAGQEGVRVAIISGRRLDHIRRLLPLPGMWLAGTYGIEWQLPGGEQVARLQYDQVRRPLELIKPAWVSLAGGVPGFFLEDKGWSLALHARHADKSQRGAILDAARQAAASLSQDYQLMGDDLFLEIKPQLAHKGQAVDFLLREHPWPGADMVYLGDDDKDEQAFETVRLLGGVPVRVGPVASETRAQSRLDSPLEVRQWLADLNRRRTR